jgi:hypothetical protein
MITSYANKAGKVFGHCLLIKTNVELEDEKNESENIKGLEDVHRKQEEKDVKKIQEAVESYMNTINQMLSRNAANQQIINYIINQIIKKQPQNEQPTWKQVIIAKLQMKEKEFGAEKIQEIIIGLNPPKRPKSAIPRKGKGETLTEYDSPYVDYLYERDGGDPYDELFEDSNSSNYLFGGAAISLSVLPILFKNNALIVLCILCILIIVYFCVYVYPPLVNYEAGTSQMNKIDNI